MRYQFIEKHIPEWPVTVQCRVLKVSRSGFYEWRRRPKSEHEKRDEILTSAIEVAHRKSRGTYGSPRVYEALRREWQQCGKNRVARLMAKAGLAAKGKRKFRATTDSNHKHQVAENILNRVFHAVRPDEKWLADITYIWTRSGWMYLAAILDMYSRRIVGWAVESRMTKEFACRALKMAMSRRKPRKGLVHHSDRGSQYASNDYQELLKKAGMISSMSRKGNC